MIGPTDPESLRVMVEAADRQPPLSDAVCDCETSDTFAPCPKCGSRPVGELPRQWLVIGPHESTEHATAAAAWEAALGLFEDVDVDRVSIHDRIGDVAYTVKATDR